MNHLAATTLGLLDVAAAVLDELSVLTDAMIGAGALEHPGRSAANLRRVKAWRRLD